MNKLRKTVRVSLTIGFVLSLLLWLVVVLNGELEPSGQPGFLAQVHHLQQPGASIAHTWFPCTIGPGGLNTGCEYLKIVPTTILLNGLIFAGVLLIPVHLIRHMSGALG